MEANAVGAEPRPLKERLMALEPRRLELETALARPEPADVVDLHPALPRRYREQIEQLEEILAGQDDKPCARPPAYCAA